MYLSIRGKWPVYKIAVTRLVVFKYSENSLRIFVKSINLSIGKCTCFNKQNLVNSFWRLKKLQSIQKNSLSIHSKFPAEFTIYKL